MIFKPDIQQSNTLTNKELYKLFQCANTGGMRRSHDTNSLVIVSDHTKGLYDDKWYGNEIHYTGMGSTGDQSQSFMQNRTLNESETNNVNVHLFEVYTAGQYVYQGEVALSGAPYQETQPDKENNLRLVWMFPLRLKKGIPVRFEEDLINHVYVKKIKAARKLSKNKMKEIAESRGVKKGTKRASIVSSYDRDAIIVEYALKRANGDCQLCEQPAPFNKKNGEPFLEVHHIDYLASGGDDSINNVVALCPNCHRKMHALSIERDIQKLKYLAQNKMIL